MWWRRLVARVGGEDGAGRRALPLGEFVHPLPLVALGLLAANDHFFKGRGILPAVVTGKLSDVCGVFFFPLLLTAVFDTVAYGVARATGSPIDFSLRRWKLAAAIALTGIAFAALELVPAWQRFYVATLGRIGFPSQTTPDLGDLVALVMLWPAWRLGLAHIRRVPLGRLEVIERARPHDVRRRLDDVRALARDPHTVERLQATFRSWLDDPSEAHAQRVDAALKAIRYD